MARLHRPSGRPRGVSLIEALVALAAMAFGMLAVAGLQATMRLNADIAKQRSEAVRIAQEAIEQWRGFTVLDTPPVGEIAYADLDTDGATVAVTGLTTNTAYSLLRTVTEDTALNRKILRIDVTWNDRTGTQQAVQLNSVVTNVTPELEATLAVPSTGAPAKLPRGRSAAIPVQARDFGDGRSGFKPPQNGGGTVAWVYSNATGVVTQVCSVPAATTNAGLTTGDLSSCSDVFGRTLSGYVRFATGVGSAPDAAAAESPTSTALNLDVVVAPSVPGAFTATCFDDAPATSTAAATQTTVAYFCLIVVTAADATWTGISTLTPQGFGDLGGTPWAIAASGGDAFKVCRYTPAASDAVAVANPQHPRTYTNVTARQILVNQNFLVISALWNCPTDGAANPLTGNYVNSNTLLHQPAPSP